MLHFLISVWEVWSGQGKMLFFLQRKLNELFCCVGPPKKAGKVERYFFFFIASEIWHIAQWFLGMYFEGTSSLNFII